jgi:DNA polymerase-3 subunit alpha
MGIKLLPPDINESSDTFTVSENSIRFGMAAVKNVGRNFVIAVTQERNNAGLFKSFRDFCERVSEKGINKRLVESLIKCGAFDSFKVYRSQLMATYERILDGIAQSKKKNIEGQISLFGNDDQQEQTFAVHDELPQMNEYPTKVLLSMEKEIMGLYLSGHPLDQYQSQLNQVVTASTADLHMIQENLGEISAHKGQRILGDGTEVILGGIISAKKTKTTKSNNLMAFVTLEDSFGSVEVIIFPKILDKYSNYIIEDNVVTIKGRISVREEEQPKILCEEIVPFKKIENLKKLYIKIDGESSHVLEELSPVLQFFNGDTPVYVYFEKDKKVSLASRDLWVKLSDLLLDELRNIVGDDSVRVVDCS